MKAVLFRTGSGSIPIQTPLAPGSPRLSVTLPVQESVAAVFPGEKYGVSSPRMSFQRNIRRSSSESDVSRSEVKSLSRLGSRSFSARIPEEECVGSFTLTREDRKGYAGELGFDGGGMNNKGMPGGGGRGGNGSDADGYKIGAYYQEMLKADPTNSLLLRNYGKYLHEVERNMVKAEEYYGRAILASPGDGELLSLYGKLIWETQRDESRARSYFHQALHASPHDSMILGSYAHFLWEAEEEREGEDDEEDQEIERAYEEVVSTAAFVEAF